VARPRQRSSFDSQDVFFSPVEWTKAPLSEEDVQVIMRIQNKGGIMCRSKINDKYIRKALNDPQIGVWVVRDANERIFGFALTREWSSHIFLKLICTHRRKGEGSKLFESILDYAREKKKELRLEAVNAEVALVYSKTAIINKWTVQVDSGEKFRPSTPPLLESFKKMLKRVEHEEGNVPITFS
jgi:hypothetical protein